MRRLALFALLAAPLLALAAPETGANTAAKTSGVTSEVLVSNSVATPLPATPLAGRRSVAIMNLGPNPIWCTVGSPTTPVVNKSWKIDSATTGKNTLALDVSDKIIVRCLAASQAQSTGAATVVIEVN